MGNNKQTTVTGKKSSRAQHTHTRAKPEPNLHTHTHTHTCKQASTHISIMLAVCVCIRISKVLCMKTLRAEYYYWWCGSNSCGNSSYWFGGDGNGTTMLAMPMTWYREKYYTNTVCMDTDTHKHKNTRKRMKQPTRTDTLRTEKLTALYRAGVCVCVYVCRERARAQSLNG